MSTSKVTAKAYDVLVTYVKLNRFSNRFDTNVLRNRLKSNVTGLKTSQIGSVIGTAVRRGLIEKVGETTSNNALHNGGRVGVYQRGYGSY